MTFAAGIPQNQAEVAAFLEKLAGAAPIQTHISAIFVGPNTAWKMKKAVALGFLDFSTLAARAHFCRRELELNQPAAPAIYRDVVAITRAPDGRLQEGGVGGGGGMGAPHGADPGRRFPGCGGGARRPDAGLAGCPGRCGIRFAPVSPQGRGA